MIIVEILLENHYFTLLFTGILIAASTVCEAVFLSNTINSTSDEEFDDIKTNAFKVKAVNFSKILFAVNFAILFIYISLLSFLPFCSGVTSNSLYEMFSALSPNNPSHSLISPDVILIALMYAGGAAILFKTIWHFVLKALAKREIYPVNEAEKSLISFKKRFMTISTAVLVVTVLLCVQANSYNFIWGDIIAQGIQFDSLEDFKTYAEDDSSNEYNDYTEYTLAGLTLDIVAGSVSVNIDSSDYDYSNALSDDYFADEEIVDRDGNVVPTFKWKNQEMYAFDYDSENPETSIVANTKDSLSRAQLLLRIINTAVVLLELTVIYILYAVLLKRKKRKLGVLKTSAK